VSFLTEMPNFFSIPFPLDYPVIAPFYSDVDVRGQGVVWYRYAPVLRKRNASRNDDNNRKSGLLA